MSGGWRSCACCALWLWMLSMPGLFAACAADRPDPDAPVVTCDASADCDVDEPATGQCRLRRLCIAGRCEALDDAGTAASATVRCGTPAR